MYKIRVNPVALRDLQEIKAYITEELGNPDAGLESLRKIVRRYEQLAEFPFLGTELSGVIKVRTDYRYLVCGRYLIFYRVEGAYVSIYRVLDGRRDYARILFGDNPDSEE